MNTGKTAVELRETILVVDDTPENLLVLGELLQGQYRVRAVNSGERALKSVAIDPRPDLILLDVMMPDMDGYAVLTKLRENPQTAGIPVIFITALQDEQDELKGFGLGAADYIHKPISGPIVLSRVRAQLDAKAAREMLRKSNERLAGQVEQGAQALEQVQMQLLQSEKMAAMGQLAAGVAHEINNPVGYVGSNLNTLENSVQDLLGLISAYESVEAACATAADFSAVQQLKQQIDYAYLKQDVPAMIAESKEGIGRVRQIVRDLKDFSRNDALEWQWADLHQGIDSTLNIIWNELKYHCTVTKHYGSLPKIHCLPSQLNQVFMNLLVNAGHAIEERGEITITTACEGDSFVRISISDTGKGIDAAVLPRIFEPFFTTKPVGKGTGLGLALSKGIIDRHHGQIDVSSTPGVGTTFTLILPINPTE